MGTVDENFPGRHEATVDENFYEHKWKLGTVSCYTFSTIKHDVYKIASATIELVVNQTLQG
jgi:hypothetical protein